MCGQGGRGGAEAQGAKCGLGLAAAKILDSGFTLRADAQGTRKVFLASPQLLRPGTVMDTYVAARRTTRTPGTPRPSLSEKV